MLRSLPKHIHDELDNVEFVVAVGPGHLRMRVWERGAGITSACGTGACASAVSAHRRGLTDRKVEVTLDGGPLLIEWRESDGHISMTGPATLSFKGDLDLGTVTDTSTRYRATAAYAQSKLANVMHTFALARRMAGTDITVNCLHPGVVATNLLPRWLRVIKPLITRVMFDAERGARTTVHLALDQSVAGITGRYFDEYQRPRDASPLANDVELQESLWRMSAEWTGAPQ